MNVLYAVLASVCVGGSVWAADRFLVENRKSRRFLATVLGVAVLLACTCGFLLPARLILNVPNVARILIALAASAGAAYCDLAEQRIPNLYFVLLMAGYVVCAVLDWIFVRDQLGGYLLGGLISGVVMFGLFLLLRALSKGGVGYGDIKLLTALGFLMGLNGCIGLLLFGQALALVAVVIGLLTHKLTMKGYLPLAPFFYLGLVTTILVGIF